jgi:general secretion pathway protein D
MRNIMYLLFFAVLSGSFTVMAKEKQEQLNARLSLENADINAVISTVAELTGRNFIVDPKVRGKVTIISGREMSVNDLYEVFLSVLQVHGYVAIPDGNATKIVPDATAKYITNTFIDGNSSTNINRVLNDDFVSQVIDIYHISAAKLVPILRPLVSPKGHLVGHASTNTLVILDRKVNIDHLLKIIRRIDQESSSDLDIIMLEHASASDLVRVLNQLNQRTKGKEESNSSAVVIADERTNSILVSGDKSDRLQVKAVIAHLDTPMDNAGDTEVIYLKYAKSKELAAVLSGLGKDYLKGKKVQGGNNGAASTLIVNVHAYEDANALVINAPPELMKSMRMVIRQLDIRRAQVLVEAIIAEISMDKNNEYGIQWVGDGASNGNGPIGLVNFGALGSVASSLSGSTPTLPSGAMMGIGAFGVGESVKFAMLLSAMSGNSDNNILSTPSIITVDNEEAEIIVAENVPFITGKETSASSGTGNPFQTVQRKDVGLTLKVKPQINQDGTVTMDIKQEVSQVKDQNVGAAKDLSTTKRSIRTTVLVENGQVIVLGGLMDEQVDENESKVPLLGDLPLIGAAFKYRSGKLKKRNLMVFIKTSIVTDSTTAFKLTKQKYQMVRNKQIGYADRRMGIIESESSPLLPEFDQLLELPPAFSGNQPSTTRF